MDVPWQVFSFGVLVLIWLIGMRGIEVNTILLGIFLVLELSILVLTFAAFLFRGQLAPEAFEPSTAFSGNFPLAMLFAMLSFIGFEATAVFGEETKNPKKTVARATYAAIWVIAVLYALSSWSAVSAHRGGDVSQVALDHADDFVQSASVVGLGPWAGHVFNWLLLVSIFACCLAVHNMASRYLYAFGRDKLLPKALSRTHVRFNTPHIASTVQFAMTTAVVGVCAAMGAAPYGMLASLSAGFSTIGVVILMVMTSAAAIRFLRNSEEPLFVRLIAPALAGVSLFAVLVTILLNFDKLAGESTISALIPWAFSVIIVAGYLHGKFHHRAQSSRQSVLPDPAD
jgi:amino acid transporter